MTTTSGWGVLFFVFGKYGGAALAVVFGIAAGLSFCFWSSTPAWSLAFVAVASAVWSFDCWRTLKRIEQFRRKTNADYQAELSASLAKERPLIEARDKLQEMVWKLTGRPRVGWGQRNDGHDALFVYVSAERDTHTEALTVAGVPFDEWKVKVPETFNGYPVVVSPQLPGRVS